MDMGNVDQDKLGTDTGLSTKVVLNLLTFVFKILYAEAFPLHAGVFYLL